MKCDKCGEELDFQKIRIKNYLKTGELALKFWLIIEDWPSEFKNFYSIRREVRALCSNSDYADRYVDLLNSLHEDRYLKAERPKVRKEIAYLDHLFAFSMDTIQYKPRDAKIHKLEMRSTQAWNEKLGDLEIEIPLSDEIVTKMLLKFGEKYKKFYITSFIDAFELDKKQVDRVVENLLLLQVLKWEKSHVDLLEEEGKGLGD
jgi:hypothetical protein